MSQTLIRNAYALLPEGGRLSDMLLENGRIAAIGDRLPHAADAEVIDASGCFLLPGLIDAHCHLRDPGFEYKENIRTGTRAAAAGGFTSLLCMANTSPVNDCGSVTEYIRKKAAEAGFAKVYPVGAVSKGLKGLELAEMGDMRAAGAVAFSDDGEPVASARLMELALLYAKAFGSYIISHPEEKSLSEGGCMNRGKTATRLGLMGIPAAAEELMIARDLLLAQETGCPLHLAHLSTKGGVEMVRAAKAKGVPVTCETTPHYIFLTDEACEGYDVNAKVSPPLRTPQDREALIEGLLDGTIDLIATDHAPHHIDDKCVEFPLAAKGVSGFETAFAVCYTALVASGRMPLETLVEKLSAAPARRAGIEGGVLRPGAPADLVLADGLEWQVDRERFLSKGHNTPFHGMLLRGRILRTLLDGETVYLRKDC